MLFIIMILYLFLKTDDQQLYDLLEFLVIKVLFLKI